MHKDNSVRDLSVQDEKNLVERAQKRDPEAFAQIYETYFIESMDTRSSAWEHG